MPFMSNRWFHYGLEAILALTAIVCAIGWRHSENKSHFTEIVDRLASYCDGMPNAEYQVSCKDVEKDGGLWRVEHYVVRRERRFPDD